MNYSLGIDCDGWRRADADYLCSWVTNRVCRHPHSRVYGCPEPLFFEVAADSLEELVRVYRATQAHEDREHFEVSSIDLEDAYGYDFAKKLLEV